MAPKLGEFEGRKVTKTTISVRNAGDGLSKAMEVDPQLLHQGDTVYVVMECKVGPVEFDVVKNSDTDATRKHVLRAGAATIVDAKLVQHAVEAQTQVILEAREHELGIQQLPTDEKLTREHGEGKHDNTPYIGCPTCYPIPGKAKATKAVGATKKTPRKAAGTAKKTAKKAASK